MQDDRRTTQISICFPNEIAAVLEAFIDKLRSFWSAHKFHVVQTVQYIDQE